MPIYEYVCEACGPFAAMRPMAEFHDPWPCPVCNAAAPRNFLSAPSITGMDSARRGILASNERGASGPRPATAAHPAGCGCCVRRWPLPSALSPNGGRVFSSNGPLRRGGR